jgi:hypothetical protein
MRPREQRSLGDAECWRPITIPLGLCPGCVFQLEGRDGDEKARDNRTFTVTLRALLPSLPAEIVGGVITVVSIKNLL